MWWGVYQTGRAESQANAASARASQAQTKALSTEDRLIRLEHRVEGLALACQSLWEIASDKVGIDQATLLAKMEEIDLRDGVQDGRMKRHSQNCPKCERVSKSDRMSCLYCGHELPGDGHAFGV